ncbi:MAG TPA: hypothetical protein VNO33_16495 [Kofleriaceae bacterium]|nr:hypothetical protein [Kofleriaceae bacterium]
MARVATAAALALALIACSSSGGPTAVEPAEGAATADAGFWRWFRAHAGEAATIRQGSEPIMAKLAAELHRVDERLTVEVGGIASTAEPKELIISAGGLREVFPVVQRLVAAAPPIDGWRVIAFRPRKPGHRLQFRDREVGGEDLRFRIVSPPQAGRPLDIAVYLETPAVDETSMHVVFLLLDFTLGEFDVATQLGKIEILPISQAPGDARPLTELTAIVDGRKSAARSGADQSASAAP